MVMTKGSTVWRPATAGVFVRQEHLAPAGVGDLVYGCPQEDPASVLRLSSPDLDATFEQIKDRISALKKEYLSLEEATGMDVATFYQIFQNPDNTTCLETPADLWR